MAPSFKQRKMQKRRLPQSILQKRPDAADFDSLLCDPGQPSKTCRATVVDPDGGRKSRAVEAGFTILSSDQR
ncbi:hypothetical protein KSP40_PGU015428 [Platanthera guangdongensis]|uniref:Uncharacterized protein n=1 Tax=Platanthera guangdongensis TaxID=2320717 RepID=A0ABR2LIM5_9ASPA